jgi:hypothetical protein
MTRNRAAPWTRFAHEPAQEVLQRNQDLAGEEDAHDEDERPVHRFPPRAPHRADSLSGRRDHPEWVIPSHPAAQEDRAVADVAPRP